MKEIFVIYNKNTGFIDGGTARIDREWDERHKDGSTISERIPQILAKNPNRRVVYLPNQNLPDPEKHKIKGNKIVELTEEDKLPTEEQLNEEKIQKKMREIAIESLKAEGELPLDYKEEK